MGLQRSAAAPLAVRATTRRRSLRCVAWPTGARERTARGGAHEQEGVPAAVGQGDLKLQVVVDELPMAARRRTSGSWRRCGAHAQGRSPRSRQSSALAQGHPATSETREREGREERGGIGEETGGCDDWVGFRLGSFCGVLSHIFSLFEPTR